MCHVVSRRIFLKFELTLILSSITLSTVSLALNQGAWKKSETDDRVKIACLTLKRGPASISISLSQSPVSRDI